LSIIKWCNNNVQCWKTHKKDPFDKYLIILFCIVCKSHISSTCSEENRLCIIVNIMEMMKENEEVSRHIHEIRANWRLFFDASTSIANLRRLPNNNKKPTVRHSRKKYLPQLDINIFIGTYLRYYLYCTFFLIIRMQLYDTLHVRTERLICSGNATHSTQKVNLFCFRNMSLTSVEFVLEHFINGKTTS